MIDQSKLISKMSRLISGLRPSQVFLLIVVVWALNASAFCAEDRPNILWLSSEDNGCELGCYGDTYATTPSIDRLASQAMRFNNAWSNAPVCAPARTAIITGMWPPSLGASHMRSAVGLPAQFQPMPKLLQQAGYYCSNRKKEDYNLTNSGKYWNDSSMTADWSNRKPGQPFFSVYNFEISHESKLRTRPHVAIHDPSQVKLPAYHPDLPEIRQDWAQYYDRLTEMDAQIGDILARLDNEGLRENTIVFYFGDHGSGMPRGKRWLYQSGLHVPLLISVPEKFRKLAGSHYAHQSTSDELVSFIDLAPTVLSLCGVDLPANFDGRAIVGSSATAAPKYAYGFRDRMDERYDCTRAIRDQDFLYIRNFMPHRAQGQYLEYMYQTPTTTAWLNAAKTGKTNAAQSLFWQLKPYAELYDLKNDPDQVHNLIDDESLSDVRHRLADELDVWLIEQRDLGLMPESVMKQVSINAAPFEMATSETTFPIHEILAAAKAATDPTVATAEVIKNLESSNVCVQYWSMVGLTYRALRGESVPIDLIEKSMTPDAPAIVQIAASEMLARVTDSPKRTDALGHLVGLSVSDQADFFVKMAALDSMVACNLSIDELDQLDSKTAKNLKQVIVSDNKLNSRYETYVGRDITSLFELADHPELFTPIGQ